MATRRQRKVSELVHRELSVLLMREVRDPRLSGITLTEVRVTPDLQVARVYYTILGDAEETRAAGAALESAGGYLRTQLGSRVRLRLVPELVFQLDQSAAYGRHIDELLAQISEDNEPEDESDPA